MLRLRERDFVCGCEVPEEYPPRFHYYIQDILNDLPQFDRDNPEPLPGTSLVFISNGSDVLLLDLSSDAEGRGRPVILLNQQQDRSWLAGFYYGPCLVVHENYRNRGLGAELALKAALVREGPPTADYDEQMFTSAGLRAHKAAWRLGVERGVIEVPKAALHR